MEAIGSRRRGGRLLRAMVRAPASVLTEEELGGQ